MRELVEYDAETETFVYEYQDGHSETIVGPAGLGAAVRRAAREAWEARLAAAPRPERRSRGEIVGVITLPRGTRAAIAAWRARWL